MKGYINNLYLFLSLLIAVWVYTLAENYVKNFEPKNLGLGRDTSAKENFNKNVCISTTEAKNITGFLNCVNNENLEKIFILGASQLHAINNPKINDKIAVEYANLNIKDKYKFYQISSPNASLNDILIMFLLLLQNNANFKVLIIPFVFDDLREYPIQKSFLNELKNQTMVAYKDIDIVNKLLNKTIDENSYKNEKKNTITSSEQLENYTIYYLEYLFPSFKERGKISTKISADIYSNIEKSLRFFYKVVLMTENSKQRYPNIPDHLIKWNIDALDAIIKIANENKIKVIIYRQPIRPTINEPFYFNRTDYDNIFSLIKKRESNDVIVFDIENIVPTNFWGQTNLGYPDIFHFTVDGHILLSNELIKFIGK